MKKIIGIIFISLMFANIGFAEIRLLEADNLGGESSGEFKSGQHGINSWIGTVCVDGYKFAVYSTMMVQFYEAGNNQSSKPAKC